MWYNDLRPDSELNNDRYSLIMLDKENNYARLFNEAQKERTIANLVGLKEGLLNKLPGKKVDENLLLCSWNIKNFGTLEHRTPESLYYIAQIIDAFDIVALQEVNGDLTDFKRVLSILGSNWKHIITDVTEGNAGNDERFAFIYDSRRVQHSGLSGEIVIPPEDLAANPIISQLKRTPTFTGFKSGWREFAVVSVHLHPGDDSNGAGEPTDQELRKEEVRLLINILQDRLHNNEEFEQQNLIILGDTNLYKEDTDIVELITDTGFKECENLIGKFTNTSLNQIYDRIFLNVSDYFKLAKNASNKENGGVFNVFDYVYKDNLPDIAQYHDLMEQHKANPDTLTDPDAFRTYFNRYWKRNQISDHLPVWIEIQTDSSISFLNNKLDKFNN